MNCLTPHDAVCNLLDLVQRELIKQIDEHFHFYGGDAEHELLTPFTRNNWHKQEPYCGMVLELHECETTFAAQIGTMRANGGELYASEYAAILGVQVREHVEGRIQFYRMKEAEYEQQKLHMESGLQHENLVYVWQVRQDDPSHGIDSQIHLPRADGMPVLQG